MMPKFFILHIYLATTGHTPLVLTKSMVTGW
jgi:thiosulfate reductase cytochrome b subunit